MEICTYYQCHLGDRDLLHAANDLTHFVSVL